MIFNSIEFLFFLPTVFFIYWLIGSKNTSKQNLFIVFASYFFYGWWSWKFLSLIIVSTLVDYFIGIQLYKAKKRRLRKLLLLCSILVNIGFLAFFKYYNFFIENLISAYTLLGKTGNFKTLSIVLPVGISFYTFQTLGYTIDVYKKTIKPCTSLVNFSAFVSFFPQLVAGPIEKAKDLLPQFNTKRQFSYNLATDGLRQILWGLFKKIVIADNCAVFVNYTFENFEHLNGSSLVLGAILFSFQIYCDFSGYSDIAIGTAKLFGFNLTTNFKYPYFSKSISEFWKKWHISLSTWFKDYLYLPLGGNKISKSRTLLNIIIVFTISGLWHGAQWNFIFWGFLNALYFLPTKLFKRKSENKSSKNFLISIVNRLGIFFLVTFSWIFFRAENITVAFTYLQKIFTNNLFSLPELNTVTNGSYTLFLLLIFIIIEINGRHFSFSIENLNLVKNKFLRWLFYIILIITICCFGGEEQNFIYFQF